MTPTTKKEIREEFTKEFSGNYNDDGYADFTLTEIADWWLSQLDHLLEAKIKAIEGEKKGKYPWQSLQFQDCPECGQEVNRKWVDEKCKEIRNDALDLAINILREQGERNP